MDAQEILSPLFLNRAIECDISWSLSDDVSDSDLQGWLFPKKSNVQNHRMPDFEYIHKELAKKWSCP